MGERATAMQEDSFIDCNDIDKMLNENIEIVVSVDGSEQSSCGLDWVLESVMQQDKATHLHMVHIHDPAKDYLPPRYKENAVKAHCEAKVSSWLLPKRYHLDMLKREADVSVGEQLCKVIHKLNGNFLVMGYKGISGRKPKTVIGSNVMEVIQRGRCSCIIMRTEDPKELPSKRPTKFVVSTGLNNAATKAFLDAVRLSKPGDEIHVVYIRPFSENQLNEGVRTKALREKYAGIFEGMKDPQKWPSQKMQKFGDRVVAIHLQPQGRGESVAEALVRKARCLEADFVLVGTNALRVEKGKPILGSVSLQIMKEWEGNLVVSNYISSRDGLTSLPSGPLNVGSSRPGTAAE
mmetsp:Transcript_89374/g.193456  ORF Transcript_89374/g.193456 Transcript_89374/m.193456 type:complete len:349 (-) Transcript_89374:41-1087(-)